MIPKHIQENTNYLYSILLNRVGITLGAFLSYSGMGQIDRLEKIEKIKSGYVANCRVNIFSRSPGYYDDCIFSHQEIASVYFPNHFAKAYYVS